MYFRFKPAFFYKIVQDSKYLVGAVFNRPSLQEMILQDGIKETVMTNGAISSAEICGSGLGIVSASSDSQDRTIEIGLSMVDKDCNSMTGVILSGVIAERLSAAPLVKEP